MFASHKGFGAAGKRRTGFGERTASAVIVEVTTSNTLDCTISYFSLNSYPVICHRRQPSFYSSMSVEITQNQPQRED